MDRKVDRKADTKSDIKSDIKRLMLYLAFTFGITWAIFFAYILSGNIWAADGEISAMDQFVSLGMLCPALAALLTRYVTKEGFAVTGEDSMLLMSINRSFWN